MAATGGVVVVWSALAARSPELTYHFAPLLAAVAGPWLVQSTLGRQDRRTAALATGVAFAMTVLTAAALHVADRLRGPTFWSDSGAFGEALLFGLIGAALGFVLLVRRPSDR